MNEKQIAHFWSKVDKRGADECWLWRGRLNARGYGMLDINKRGKLAHRLSFELHVRPLADSDECACHKCDNPPCVNPGHLFPGTRKENLVDMRNKGRGCKPPLIRGEAHPKTPLTEANVLYIRAVAARGNYSALGRQFGISPQAIRQIVLRRFWRHI